MTTIASTNNCEQTFSVMKLSKLGLRVQITDENLNVLLRMSSQQTYGQNTGKLVKQLNCAICRANLVGTDNESYNLASPQLLRP
jgi:hypothetical protein